MPGEAARVKLELTEKQFARQVADCAKALGWLRYHTWRSERSPAGFPDEVLARDRVVYLELKTAKGKPSPFQVEWLDALARAGAETYLARPSDLDDVARILRRWWRYEPGQLRHDTAERTEVWTPGCLWLPGVGRADSQKDGHANSGQKEKPLQMPLEPVDIRVDSQKDELAA